VISFVDKSCERTVGQTLHRVWML